MNVQDQLIPLLTPFLGVDAPPLTPQTRFDELGLDSLASLRFARKTQDALGIPIDVEWVFDHPTLGEFAALVEARIASGVGAGTAG